MNDLAVYSGVMLFSVFVSAVSQVLLKREALRPHENHLKEYLNVGVMTAYVLFFASTLLTLIAYKVVPLSFGPILEATSYIYICVFGYIFFMERLTVRQIFGIACIIGGVFVYSLV